MQKSWLEKINNTTLNSLFSAVALDVNVPPHIVAQDGLAILSAKEHPRQTLMTVWCCNCPALFGRLSKAGTKYVFLAHIKDRRGKEQVDTAVQEILAHFKAQDLNIETLIYTPRQDSGSRQAESLLRDTGAEVSVYMRPQARSRIDVLVSLKGWAYYDELQKEHKKAAW